MFTGIIETTAEVLSRTSGGLVLARPAFFKDLKKGSSVCVSGACLTVTKLTAKSMAFDVVPETWRRTTLGTLEEGNVVNLERALPATGRFDGHIVQGHVEGVGIVRAVSRQRSAVSITIALPSSLLPSVVSKGSIALDGVSLTVAAVKGNACTVALIPETLQRTTLGLLKKGSRVNVETDILARFTRPVRSRSSR
jgi:riboflavin synthase